VFSAGAMALIGRFWDNWVALEGIFRPCGG
jgi:hypothetical protein